MGDITPSGVALPSCLHGFATPAARAINILGSVFTILAYAEKCGAKVSKVGFADLEIGSNTVPADVPFFTRRQATLIIEAARETVQDAVCSGVVYWPSRRRNPGVNAGRSRLHAQDRPCEQILG
jgi:hypothetical protein